jgi:hypothetical protein
MMRHGVSGKKSLLIVKIFNDSIRRVADDERRNAGRWGSGAGCREVGAEI